MPRRRRAPGPPGRLTSFFSPIGTNEGQDGAGSSLKGKEQREGESTRAPVDLRLHYSLYPGDPGDASPPLSPNSRSPAKSKPRLEENQSVLPSTQTYDVAAPLHIQIPDMPTIEAIPATDQPISEICMKNMMLSLQQAIRYDIQTSVTQVAVVVQKQEHRLNHIESRMEEIITAHNDLIDAHTDHTSDIDQINMKLADLEDRSRRNNIKFRGVPENVTNDALSQYIHQYIKILLPNVADLELAIDRAHRLPKPSFLPASIPRDVLCRIHFYHIKEKIMTAARNPPPLPPSHTNLRLFADLSRATLINRKKLVTITKALRNHNIPYQWGFPTKLTVKHHGRIFTIRNLEEGLDLLKVWNILPSETPQLSTTLIHPMEAE